MRSRPRSGSELSSPRGRVAAYCCVLFALLTAVYPFASAFRLEELNYNEGWNVYNAMKVAAGGQLYPAGYEWTAVNYPMGSFALIAALHRVTGDYLFTGRALSVLGLLLCCGALAGIARALGSTRRATVLTAALCLAVFCLENHAYIGMDDPQMLAQGVFMTGLLVYVRGRSTRRRTAWIALAALLFALGGSIKQSPIDVPLAVLMDVLFLSLPLAAWFAVCGLGFAAVSVWLNLHFGGPWFVRDLLAGRGYSDAKLMLLLTGVFGPLLPAFVLAACMALALRRDPVRRIAAVLFAVGLVVGGYFLGGKGVAQNAVFTAMLALVLLVGLAFSAVETGEALGRPMRWLADTSGRMHALRAWLPLAVYASLVCPAMVFQSANPMRKLRDMRAEEPRFAAEVALLRAQPGPAMCESLLRCALAGKPYVYDPFNATRFVELGKLDQQVMVQALDRHAFGAVQMALPPPGNDATRDRFAPHIMDAITRDYVPALRNQDAVIYLPRR